MTDRRRLAANADPGSGSQTGQGQGHDPGQDPDRDAGREPGHESGHRPGPGAGAEPGRDAAHGRGHDQAHGQGGDRDGGRRDRKPPHEDNPFAAPPEDAPERPWRPRRPHGEKERHDEETSGHEGRDGRWSPQQPRRHEGGFGGPGRSAGPGPGGPGGGEGGRKPGLRWDPTDPKQRHARYALHGGIWGLFFAMFGQTEIALLLGALSVYWGVNALRGPSSVRSTPHAAATAEDVAGTDRTDPQGGGPYGGRPAGAEVAVTPAQAAKARKAAAVSGLVAGILSLLAVAGDFTQRMVYEEYYTCRQDALTQAAREQCHDLPEGQVPFWITDPEARPNG